MTEGQLESTEKNKVIYLNKLNFSKNLKVLLDDLHTVPKGASWQFLAKKLSNPSLTKSGKVKLAQKELTISSYRKVQELFESINDAKAVLLRYKSDLMTIVSTENNCITPLTASKKLSMVFYKREDLTSIKAYKIRGALYQMSKIIEQNHSKELRFVAASTGNHALGVLKAAEILRVPRVTICISASVTPIKQKKLNKRVSSLLEKGINAELIIEGENFDQTNQFAKNLVKTSNHTYYIDPYNTHNAVAGQGTIGIELLSQLENQFFDFEKLEVNNSKIKRIKEITIIVPIGGGGLISGISTGFKMGIHQFPKLKHVKITIIGVKLSDLNSKHGDAIRVKIPGDHNLPLMEYLVDRIIDVTDMDMQRGINFLADDIGTKVEGASAGTLKPVLEKIVQPSEENAVICIISGGNTVFHL